GIGAVVAGCFGVITSVRTRDTLRASLNADLTERTIGEAESLADYLTRPLVVHDVVAVRQILAKTTERNTDIVYIVVRDPDGDVLTHTFVGSVPEALREPPAFLSFPAEAFRVMDAGEAGLVFEASRPVMNGHAGYVQLGWSNRGIAEELATLRNTILASLAICAALGIGLALLLSLAITHPVRHLNDAVQQVRQHNLDARATVFAADEIGSLAAAFNDMAETLAQNDKTIMQKEKARAALVRRIITAQEQERKSISRELHDQIGQSLLALLVDMKSQSSGAHPGESAQGAQERIEDLIEEVRQVSKGMHPSILDDYGLDSALRTYVKDTAARHSVRIEYETNCPDGCRRLPEATEIALYRIAQEAISNALRHAHPSHISVILLIDPEHATLLVEDDGSGFCPDQMAPGRGMGLLSMNERCSLVGGTLDITSDTGDGAIVRARVPVQREMENQA
ncbi:MAG: HAMP domain-containing protein, partial [Verrucomicrobia bacterium]|nr:HAMP domain-containing protein [Verrucomicrobiota bacterium]